MIDSMSSRGPDSAGFAIYDSLRNKKLCKFSICFPENLDINDFVKDIKKRFKDIQAKQISDHLIITTSSEVQIFRDYINHKYNNVSIVGYGQSIEIFKQVGNPKEVVKKFQLKNFQGTHGIGHTRMATESAITTNGSHPYSTGKDECLVHNGSLSNHNNLRRVLIKKGKIFDSQNDTEVAAGYISNKLQENFSLKETLKIV